MVEVRSAAPWMASTSCQNAGCPVCEADEKQRFSRAERLDRMSRPGLVEVRSAAPWMASTFCQNAGCPVCEADEKQRFSRAERLDRMSRPGLVEVRSAAPWMASTFCQNAGCPVCEADEKQRFSRGEGKRLRSAASRADRAPPSCARWPDERLDRMSRLGLVEARSAAPWMASTSCQNAGCPVCEADEKQRFSRGEGKRLRSAASRADRAPPSCARWPDERLDRMSRLGWIEVRDAAPWMAWKMSQNPKGRIHGVR